MAEWGNGTGAQAQADMDSNGQKLKVRSTSGAYAPSDYRVEIEEATDGFRRALKVKGNLTVEQSTSFLALDVKGSSEFRPLAGQTNPALQVSGDTRTVLTRNGHADTNTLEVEGKTVLSKLPGTGVIAAIVDGSLRIQKNGEYAGTLRNGPIITGQLEINTAAGDPDVKIGAIGEQGNTVSLLADRVAIGGIGSTVSLGAHAAPVEIQGSEETSQVLFVRGDMEVTNDLHVDEVDTVAANHDLTVGGVNGNATLRLGTHASQITLAQFGSGAIISARGPVTISDGDASRQASLSVRGPLTIGLPTHPKDAAIHGTVFAQAIEGIGGTLTLQGELSLQGVITSDLSVEGSVFASQDLSVVGKTTLGTQLNVGSQQDPANVEIFGAMHLTDKLNVDGLTALQSELDVQDVAQFHARTHHLNGASFTPNGASFSGLIYQNSRLEFFVAGTLPFYIDNTGGHNA